MGPFDAPLRAGKRDFPRAQEGRSVDGELKTGSPFLQPSDSGRDVRKNCKRTSSGGPPALAILPSFSHPATMHHGAARDSKDDPLGGWMHAWMASKEIDETPRRTSSPSESVCLMAAASASRLLSELVSIPRS